MVSHGLPFASENIRTIRSPGGRALEEEVADAVEAMRVGHPVLTALVFSNDDLALMAIQHLESAGLRIPEDISVVGYDDIFDWPGFGAKGLTTVAQDLCGIGRTAGEILIERLRGKGNARLIQVFVKPRLIVRDTVKDLRAPGEI
jgi:DNA-binding LacI/PurR family transcriptional regulator